MADKKKIGLFGGTFDPIHNGHVHLALYLIENKYVDRLLFCPTQQNPLKKKSVLSANLYHRQCMVKIVLEKISNCELIEESKGSSFFIDTLRDVKNKFVNDNLYFIHGADILNTFHQWKDPEEILKISTPIIFARKTEYQKLEELHSFSQTLKEAIIDVPLFDISSTVIRSRLKNNKTCLHLIPHKVFEYIQEHDLYKDG